MDKTFLRNLIAFLGKAMPATYAGNGTPVPDGEQQRRPGFTEFVFTDGPWSYRDSYTGFLTSAGQEVVWFEGAPVWAQSYAGGMMPGYREPELARKCFDFLKRALSQRVIPFQPRGPGVFRVNDWSYDSHVHGDVSSFDGKETVSYCEDAIFFHHFCGGVILHG